VDLSRRIALREFWNVLPMAARRRTLATLSRMVAQAAFGAQKPTMGREVCHD
jgi:hypothetical protein